MQGCLGVDCLDEGYGKNRPQNQAKVGKEVEVYFWGLVCGLRTILL